MTFVTPSVLGIGMLELCLGLWTDEWRRPLLAIVYAWTYLHTIVSWARSVGKVEAGVEVDARHGATKVPPSNMIASTATWKKLEFVLKGT